MDAIPIIPKISEIWPAALAFLVLLGMMVYYNFSPNSDSRSNTHANRHSNPPFLQNPNAHAQACNGNPDPHSHSSARPDQHAHDNAYHYGYIYARLRLHQQLLAFY